jgi:putative ABC transport system permease protein
VQKKNIGYNKDNVIYFDIEGKAKQNLATLLVELQNVPGVVSASSAGQSMVGGGNTSKISWEGKNPSLLIPFAYRPANYGLMELLEFELVKGRSFSRDYSDSLAVIFNEAGIKAMGMESPIGKTIEFGGMDCKIIGVVKDFNFTSLRQNVDPMFFILAPQYTEKVMVRLDNENVAGTLERLNEFYMVYNPGFTFDFRFLDQDYQEQYASEMRVAELSKYFAGIAILISCLGLFGLAAFTADRRTKEIGIRKILGSSEFGIVRLLSSDFTKMVLMAIALALPVSYFIAERWLENFAFNIALEWWFFIGAGIIALVIAWLTIGLQIVKAAGVNPVNCLRNE